MGDEQGWAGEPAEDPGYPAWEAWLPETASDEDAAGPGAPWYAPSGSRGGRVWPGAPGGFGTDAGPGPVYAEMEEDAAASAGYAAAPEDRRRTGDEDAGAVRWADAGDPGDGAQWPGGDDTWADAGDPGDGALWPGGEDTAATWADPGDQGGTAWPGGDDTTATWAHAGDPGDAAGWPGAGDTGATWAHAGDQGDAPGWPGGDDTGAAHPGAVGGYDHVAGWPSGDATAETAGETGPGPYDWPDGAGWPTSGAGAGGFEGTAPEPTGVAPSGDGGEDAWPGTVTGPGWAAGDATAGPYGPGTADVAAHGTQPEPGDTAGVAGWPGDTWGDLQPPAATAPGEQEADDWRHAQPAPKGASAGDGGIGDTWDHPWAEVASTADEQEADDRRHAQPAPTGAATGDGGSGDTWDQPRPAAPAPEPGGGEHDHRHIDAPVARLRPHPSAPARPHPVAPVDDRAAIPVPPRRPLAPLPPLTAPPPAPPRPPARDAAWAPQRGGGTLTLAPDEAPPVRADDTPPGAPAPRSSTRNAVEWVVIIAAALIAALVIKTYLLQAFYIPSPSMEPTLNIQDRVLVNKLSYRLHDVHRGDVVVFERPPNDVGTIRDLIKRVIGLPGDTVEGKDGGVWINGQPLSEPYLPRGTVTSTFAPKTIPPGYIWVMGDNRSNSSDSRVFGVVDEDRIVGRAFVRVWPLSAIGLL